MKFLRYPKALVLIVATLLLVTGIYLSRQRLRQWLFRPTATSTDQGITAPETPENLEVVAQNLNVPWEMAWLPEGDMLVTERSGVLRRIGQNQQNYVIAGVTHQGEGGLLGLALHPDFEQNRFLYLYLTSRQGQGLINRVERYRLTEDALSERLVILDNIPGAANHDGGRLSFGPDKLLYITTGDAGVETAAQDTASLAGKILRLHANGAIPADNPFNNPVYSYGHRNPQGLAWNERGQLYATEHGRSGFDEFNRIQKGGNYGWPEVEGDKTAPGMVPPLAHSGASDTWAPGGLAYFKGRFFFSGLRGQSLYEVTLTDSTAAVKNHLRGEYGRLRAVVSGPDGALYITTSNTDGRGNPQPNDDKIIRLSPELFR